MRRLLCTAIALTLVSSLAIPAGAHTKRFNTRITNAEPTPGNYRGQVFSGSHACVRKRGLKIWRDVPGSDDEFLNDFKADSDGRWEYHFLGTEYYVTARRVARGSGDHRHVCRADRSPTV
jgi:hypothetical protein